MNHIMGNFMEGWHLSKGVSITHILTTISAVVAVLFYLTDIDKRVAVNKVKIEQTNVVDNTLKAEIRNMGLTIVEKLDSMETRQYEHLEQHMKDSEAAHRQRENNGI